MTVPLTHYVKVKNKYCIAYFGNCFEYLIQLALLRPLLEKTLPGISIYLACKDEALYLLQGQENILSRSVLKDKKDAFGYVREIHCDMENHPVEELLLESNLPMGPLVYPQRKDSGICLIAAHGLIPTKSLRPEQVDKIKQYVLAQEMTPLVEGQVNHQEAEWVIGVESVALFGGGANGAKVSLVPTGLGTNLFKKLFPEGEILKF